MAPPVFAALPRSAWIRILTKPIQPKFQYSEFALRAETGAFELIQRTSSGLVIRV